MLFVSLLILLIVIALKSFNISSQIAVRICWIILVSTSTLSYFVYESIFLGSGISIYGGIIQVTNTSNFIDILITLIAAGAILPWAPVSILKNISYLTSSNDSVFTLVSTNIYYSLLILFSVSGSSLLISSSSLICLYLSLELQSFAVYVLATLYRNSESATDAGLTYFLLGGLSSCFILLGSAQLYSSLGVINLDQIYILLSVGYHSISWIVAFSFTILSAGLFFKIAAAPFHQWAADVYDRVPTIITLWLQTIPKLAVLGLLLEITSGLTLNSSFLDLNFSSFTYNAWMSTLIIVAILSLTIGSILGLAQVRIKRLLTYSTISHVGFILLALSAFNTDAITSFLFYLTQYSITSLASITILLAFGYVIQSSSSLSTSYKIKIKKMTDIEYISELKGLVTTQPIITLGFAFLLFSIAGIPPFIGFFAKQGVLEASLTAHYGGIALLAIIVSVISASYYLKIVRLMHFNQKDNILSNYSFNLSKDYSNNLTASHTFLLSFLILVITCYIFLPISFLDSTRILALTYFIYF